MTTAKIILLTTVVMVAILVGQARAFRNEQTVVKIIMNSLKKCLVIFLLTDFIRSPIESWTTAELQPETKRHLNLNPRSPIESLEVTLAYKFSQLHS